MTRRVWDIDDLPVVRGREWYVPGRNSGRTTLMIQDALHQVDFMERGDEVWIVFPTWEIAKRMCERVANGLARELGFAVTPQIGLGEKLSERSLLIPGSVRYVIHIEGFPFHFVSFEALDIQLRGTRFSTYPCVYFDHTCYEQLIDPDDGELYHLLVAASCTLPV